MLLLYAKAGREAPASMLQSIELQKARSSIHERNHLRLWLMPKRYKGMDVWVGSVSRDVGSYFTLRTPWLSAHAIDPEIDEARTYLEQDLLFSGSVVKFGYVKGIKPATPDNPHRNFMKQHWWTDGYQPFFYSATSPLRSIRSSFSTWNGQEKTVPRSYSTLKLLAPGENRKVTGSYPPFFNTEELN
jgi:hypothetical protein